MIKKIILAALVMAATATATAQHDNMYLIKGSHVVGKYNVDDVDYVSFTLPEGVTENNIWLTVDKVTKNSVTYTVNTVSPDVAYAHNVVSYYDANYTALNYEGDMFENLAPEIQTDILKLVLQSSSYVGIDTDTYTQTDHADDGTGGIYPYFNVAPGTRHFLCAWEIDPVSQKPLDTFVYTEFTTEQPGKSDCDVNFTFKRTNEQGVAFDVTGSGVYYLRTAWGPKSNMDLYAEAYGVDFLIGTFGEIYNLDFLQGTGDFKDGIENATWPVNGSGEYVMFVRAYDTDGDITDRRFDVTVEEEESLIGHEVHILAKEKDSGSVSVSFEITPSNVREAHVILCAENDVDDWLNEGKTLYEIATGEGAVDITSDIHTMGEYTFKATDLKPEWKALLISAADKDGKTTVLRVNFFPDTESEWSVYNPVYKAKKKVRRIITKSNPTLPR